MMTKKVSEEVPVGDRRSTAILGRFRGILAVGLLGLCLSLTGCAAMKAFLLGPEAEAPKGAEAESPAEQILAPAKDIGGPIGAAAAGLLGLINVAQAVRARKYKQGFDALVSGIDDAVESGAKPSLSKEELYHALKDAIAEKVSDPKALESLVAKLKAQRRA